MTRVRFHTIPATTAPGARTADPMLNPGGPRQRPTAPATALAALLFGLVVPGAHAAYIGNIHATGAVGPQPLAFTHAGTTPDLANNAATAAARAATTHSAAAMAAGEASTAGQPRQPDELAFNSTLTLAGIGLLCLVVHRRRSSARRA